MQSRAACTCNSEVFWEHTNCHSASLTRALYHRLAEQIVFSDGDAGVVTLLIILLHLTVLGFIVPTGAPAGANKIAFKLAVQVDY